MTLHAHIQTYSTDCDGPLSSEHVMVMTDEEKVSDFGDIEFHNRVVSSIVNTYSIFQGGDLNVANEGDNGIRLTWFEATEEGGRNTEALICDDEDCDPNHSSYRDHRAEEMGY